MLVLDRDGTLLEPQHAELPPPGVAVHGAAPQPLDERTDNVHALRRSLDDLGPTLVRQIRAEVINSLHGSMPLATGAPW